MKKKILPNILEIWAELKKDVTKINTQLSQSNDLVEQIETLSRLYGLNVKNNTELEDMLLFLNSFFNNKNLTYSIYNKSLLVLNNNILEFVSVIKDFIIRKIRKSINYTTGIYSINEQFSLCLQIINNNLLITIVNNIEFLEKTNIFLSSQNSNNIQQKDIIDSTFKTIQILEIIKNILKECLNIQYYNYTQIHNSSNINFSEYSQKILLFNKIEKQIIQLHNINFSFIYEYFIKNNLTSIIDICFEKSYEMINIFYFIEETEDKNIDYDFNQSNKTKENHDYLTSLYHNLIILKENPLQIELMINEIFKYLKNENIKASELIDEEYLKYSIHISKDNLLKARLNIKNNDLAFNLSVAKKDYIISMCK